MFGTGRIGEIIDAILKNENVDEICDLPANVKFSYLSKALDFSAEEFDLLIAENSPVLRTVKGHVFETFFDEIVSQTGNDSIGVGGDLPVDRIVNGRTLQLKTFTVAGTKGHEVQYKTHKTHGAKSELESLDYYHTIEEFADYLVGLVSYKPLRILILSKVELPTHPKSHGHILSPFTLNWLNHPALNAFNRIGVDIEKAGGLEFDPKDELLPKTCMILGVDDDVILNTILNRENFRIWDMAIRGFAREKAFEKFLEANGVAHLSSASTLRHRADKADHAIQIQNGSYLYFQVKGISTNNCKLIGAQSIVATETQLTRGRVNDHPTQSRLYLHSDFDYLVIVLDPCQSYCYEIEMGNPNAKLEWQFFAISVDSLSRHHVYDRRLKSLQSFGYLGIKNYQLKEEQLKLWRP